MRSNHRKIFEKGEHHGEESAATAPFPFSGTKSSSSRYHAEETATSAERQPRCGKNYSEQSQATRRFDPRAGICMKEYFLFCDFRHRKQELLKAVLKVQFIQIYYFLEVSHVSNQIHTQRK